MSQLKAEIARLYKPKNPIKTTCIILGVAVGSAAVIAVIDKCVSLLIGLIV